MGAPVLAQRYGAGCPANLNGAPFLLPTRNNALRGKIDEWFVQHGVRPDVVGEFEDNALLGTFGRRALGLFFAPATLALDVAEQFYMLTNERKIRHPAVEAMLAAAQDGAPPARMRNYTSGRSTVAPAQAGVHAAFPGCGIHVFIKQLVCKIFS